MKPARILVPPGIGDGYWVLVKLRGFLERHGIERPQVYVHDAGPRRAHGMWQRVPLVEFGGYAAIPTGRGNRINRATFDRAYRGAHHPVQQRVMGFDYFVSFNGSLDRGRSLDDALPGPTDWYEPMHDAAITQGHAAAFRARFGDYVAVAFWDHGFYRHWLEQFPEAAIVAALQLIADAGKTVVITGAAWDRGAIADRLAAADRRFVGLVGDTSFDELGGLLAGADAVLGFPAGSTLIGPYFRRPTVLLWHEHFPRSFWRNACPPAPEYRPLDTRTATPESVAAVVLGMLPQSEEAA